MTFDADSILDLRDEYDRQGQAYEAAASATSVVSASDESRSIEVELDTESAMLTVNIGNNWRSHYDADSLGSAVVTTVGSLAAARVAEWSDAVAEKDDAPVARTRPLPPTSETLVGSFNEAIAASGDSVDMDVVFEDLLVVLREFNAGLDEVSEIVLSRANANHSGASAGSTATATVSGTGTLTSLEFDSHWLTNRSSFEISGAINDAIAKATDAAKSAAPDNPLDGTPLARYGSVLNDPQAFTRLLFRKD
jgi:DNA-binding protein YbaB